MNKTTSILSGLALAIAAIPAAGYSQTVKEFPKMLMPAESSDMIMRAPLNTERPLGIKLFGATKVDIMNSVYFVNMYSNTPQTLERLHTVIGDDEIDPVARFHQLYCGTMTNDGYFGFRVKQYTFETHVYSFIKVDPETGISTQLADLNEASIQKNWEYIYDMAWNPTNDRLYGLAQNENGTVTSMIGQLSKSDGTFTKKVKSLDDYYFCMSFDFDGNLYAVRWDYDKAGNITGSVLDKYDTDFNKIKSFNLTVDGAAFKSYFQHTMDIDHTTGDIYWLGTNSDGYQFLMIINPDNGEVTNKGRIGYNQTITGLHVPYRTADARTAPAHVENLNWTKTAEGKNEVTLTWTNPTTAWNRSALSSLKNVLIYRDNMNGAPIATLDASNKVGQEMSYTDKDAARGVHTYYVVATVKDGEKGISESIDAFVGRDVPGPVRDLEASTSDLKSIYVSWQAPTVGDSEGWFDNSDLKYRITRLPDNKDCGETSDNFYFDSNIQEALSYSYVITPVSAEGAGTPTESNKVLAGECVIVPYSIDFSDKVQYERFTPIDGNGDNITFEYGWNNHSVKETVRFLMSEYNNDDYLVTPPTRLEAGKVYRVDYGIAWGCYGTSDVINHHNVELTAGLTPTKDGQSIVLVKDEDYPIQGLDTYEVYTRYFSVEQSGDYYIGIHMLDDYEDAGWLYIENFAITEAGDNDLAVTKLDTHLVLSNEFENFFNVDVYNNGNKDQSNYEVEVGYSYSDGTFIPFASTKNVPTIKSHETQTVLVTGKAPRNEFNDIAARVVLKDDADESNNMSEAVTTETYGGPSYNASIMYGREGRVTNYPFSHFNPYDVTQSIYPAYETELEKLEKAEIYRIGWRYNSDRDINTTNLKVYISETDKEFFNTNDKALIPVSSKPVFDGKVEIRQGENYLSIDFPEAFIYHPKSKNLLVTVCKEDTQTVNDFLVHFQAYAIATNENISHSTRYGGKNAVNIANPGNVNTFFNPEAPVLHMSVNTLSGVEEITVGGKENVIFDARRNTVVASKEIAKVVAYDLTGRKIAEVKGNGNEATVDCGNGMYILKVTFAEGASESLKVVIR